VNDLDREEAIKVLTEHIKTISELFGDKVAWPTLTGMPSSGLLKMIEWGLVKGIPIDVLLLVAAAMGFAQGKKVKATSNTKAASDTENENLEGRLATGVDFPS